MTSELSTLWWSLVCAYMCVFIYGYNWLLCFTNSESSKLWRLLSQWTRIDDLEICWASTTIGIHTYTPTYIHTYMHACMHTCMHAYNLERIDDLESCWACTTIGIHTYKHTFTHTYMHAYTLEIYTHGTWLGFLCVCGCMFTPFFNMYIARIHVIPCLYGMDSTNNF